MIEGVNRYSTGYLLSNLKQPEPTLVLVQGTSIRDVTASVGGEGFKGMG